MSSPNEIQLEQLAAAILDGTEVDWGTEESPAASPRLPLIEHLKVVAGSLPFIGSRRRRLTSGRISESWNVSDAAPSERCFAPGIRGSIAKSR